MEEAMREIVAVGEPVIEEPLSVRGYPLKVAIGVTCHAPYLPLLPQCLRSLEGQGASELWVALDDCDASIPASWRTIRGAWHHPSGGRNAILERTQADWVLFFDADNEAPLGYLAALAQRIGEDIGFVYPDLAHQEWNYWALRKANFVDTASLWRVDLLQGLGGWRDLEIWEDWELALRLSYHGWRGRKAPVRFMKRKGEEHRNQGDEQRIRSALLRLRSLAIVMLYSGRQPQALQRLEDLVKEMGESVTAVVLVDNSPDGVRFECPKPLTYIRVSERPDLRGKPYFWPERHRHVFRLYSLAFSRVREDMVLTFEDDVVPPPGTWKELIAEFRPKAPVGAVGGIYRTVRDESRVVCGKLGAWEDLTWEDFQGNLRREVMWIGGGWALWAGWPCEGYPLSFRERPLRGWDVGFSLAIREAGYKVIARGDIACLHLVEGEE